MLNVGVCIYSLYIYDTLGTLVNLRCICNVGLTEGRIGLPVLNHMSPTAGAGVVYKWGQSMWNPEHGHWPAVEADLVAVLCDIYVFKLH